MNFFNRIGDAFKYAISGKSAYGMIPTWENMQPAYPIVNYENNCKHGYRKNELIFACISLKADSAALPKLLVYSRRGKELPDHELRRMIQKPNPHMTEFDFFSLSLTMLDLAGRCYWEKVRSRAGKVVQLWPLRPDWVKPIRSAKDFIAGYEYAPAGVEKVTLKVQDVLDFKLTDPLDICNGLAPVAVAGRVGDVDNAATDYLKLFFEKGGMPPGLLKSKQKLTDTNVSDIRRRWAERYGGYKNWMNPAVLDSDAEYQRIALTFQEMGFPVLDARSEARICAVLRVPPILVGAKVGLDRSTFSNYQEARKAFWQESLMPVYKRIGDECQNDLAAEFGDVQLRWDFSAVPALQDDLKTRREQARADYTSGGLTLNEYRTQIGQEPIQDGDKFKSTPSNTPEPAKEGKSACGCHETKSLAGLDEIPNAEKRKAHIADIKTAMIEFFKEQGKRVEKEVTSHADEN